MNIINRLYSSWCVIRFSSLLKYQKEKEDVRSSMLYYTMIGLDKIVFAGQTHGFVVNAESAGAAIARPSQW